MHKHTSISLLNAQDLQKSFVGSPQKKLLLDFVMPSEMEALTKLAQAVDAVFAENSALAFQINLCLEELITNVIKYGLGNAGNHLIHVQIYQYEKCLEIFLKDDAPEFDPFTDAPAPDTNLDIEHRPIGGLGIHFVKKTMDQVKAYYDGSGNLIVLFKNL